MAINETPEETQPYLDGTNGNVTDITIIPLDASNEKRNTVPLRGKVALIVGGASENGNSLAVAFAERGIHVVIVYFNEDHERAARIKDQVEAQGQRCLLMPGELSDGDVDEHFSQEVMRQILEKFGRMDIFINYSSHPFSFRRLFEQNGNVEPRRLRSHIFPHFNMMKAALNQMVS